MRRNEEIDIQALLKKAESDDHCEAYVNLERNQNYRIGVVARTVPSESRVFIEVLVYYPAKAKLSCRI